MVAMIYDWTDFLFKLLAIMGLFFVAGILLGFSLLGLIMRHEYRMRRKKRREIAAYKASEKAMWAEVDRILAESRGL